jgi:hypothetical protein
VKNLMVLFFTEKHGNVMPSIYPKNCNVLYNHATV